MPVLTLSLLGFALAAYLVPRLSRTLIYDRSAILSGELWRLVTGSWVHLTTSHLLYNVGALGVAGWLIESRGSAAFGWLCLLSAAVIGVTLLAFESAIETYGGLSGVATAAVVYLGLQSARAGGVQQILLGIVLALVGMKLGWEWLVGQPVFVETAACGTPVVVVPLSHVAGALTAVAFFTVPRFAEWRKTSLSLDIA